jgi:hypothetical protein
MTTASPARAVDLAALHEALDAATLAAFIAEGGDDAECVREALLASSLAAADAFPEGSPDYEAFCIVLNAISQAMEVAS